MKSVATTGISAVGYRGELHDCSFPPSLHPLKLPYVDPINTLNLRSTTSALLDSFPRCVARTWAGTSLPPTDKYRGWSSVGNRRHSSTFLHLHSHHVKTAGRRQSSPITLWRRVNERFTEKPLSGVSPLPSRPPCFPCIPSRTVRSCPLRQREDPYLAHACTTPVPEANTPHTHPGHRTA